MKHHLTEQELIEYQFALASDNLTAKIAGHLGSCAQCREHREQLKRKFAALDLLREEVVVSEDLISQVVEQTSQPIRPKVIPFKPSAWIGAAAAVLVVALLLLAPHLKKDETPTHKVVKVVSEPVEKMKLRYEEEAVPPADVGEKYTSEEKTSFFVAKYDERVPQRLSNLGKGKLIEEQISEQPPFAPASAIELVILPRRDSVQLTIYNSTFQTLKMFGGYRGGFGGYGGGGYGVKPDEATRKAIEETIKRGQQHQIPSSVAGGDVTLVRERRSLTLKKGWNWLQFMWANTLIDPTSLSLEPLQQTDKIDIQQLVFPARLRELGRWLIRSEVSSQVPFEITYFTSGLSWRAFYMGTLSQDEKTMRLQGYVRISNNSGEDYEKAQTRLIVGKVHILDQIAELAKRKYPYGRPDVGYVGGYGGGGFGGYGAAFGLDMYGNGSVPVLGDVPVIGQLFTTLEPKEIKKEGLSEYFLYTIEGTETIPDKWGKRLLSLEVEDIEVKSLYKYDEERWGRQAIRFVSFVNDEEHNLGDTPIPNGTVKIYSQADSEGYLSYVGGTSVKYIPVDEEVELNLGPARLVSVEPVLMNFKTENYVFDKKKDITGWDEIRTWKMKITNTRELPIEIEITRGFGTAYWALQADIPYEKHDATHARFMLNLEPRGKRTFGYTVRTYHGVREEAVSE
jgi:hypothetical protein